MGKLKSILNVNRRKFLSAVIPACGLSCLGNVSFIGLCGNISADEEKPVVHKFQKNWCRTYEEAFEWRYRYYINYMEQFAKYLGRDNLIRMIKQAVDDSNPPAQTADPEFSFSDWIQAGKSAYVNMMTWDIIEESDTVYEMKVSECLWWKIFKGHVATDIGYASVCYTDFSYSRAVHPKLSLERTKTLMEGHDCCNHRWTFEG